MFLNKDQAEQELIKWENRLVKTCTKCKGIGSIPSDSGLNKMCTCMETAMMNTHLVACGVPAKYLTDRWTWENCDKIPDIVEICREYANNFENNYFEGKGLYLYGNQGRGKSTMEVLIAKDIAKKINPDNKKHYKVVFAIYEEIVQLSHQARLDLSAKRKLDSIIHVPELLIIDNIGSETGFGSETKYTARLLEYILRTRDNKCLPVIISGNLHPDELLESYNEPVHDFVKLNCDMVSVTGDNHRKKGNYEDYL